MSLRFEELLGQITDFVKNESRTDTVVGTQFTLGAYTCVPVLRIGVGLGAGGGSGDQPKTGKGEGGGAGVGMGIEPMGFLVAKGEHISFISTHHSKGLGAAFEKLPDLLESYMQQNAAKEKEKSAV